MLEKTTNLQLPLLVQNQAGKEITHNEALIILDKIVQNGIIDKDLTTPPTEPYTNDLYIVGENATGLWEDKDNQLAFYDNGWRFIEPRKGFIFWINDESKLYCFNGTKWQEITSSNSGETTPIEITELQNLSLLGVNTTANEDNKLSIKSNYVLFDNITDNSRIKVNKAITNNTASHLFQTNYSGRAEFGLIGDDNFTLKVSNDGENWHNAFVVDKTTGNTNFTQELFCKNINLKNFGIPSSTVVELTVQASGSTRYTAPANGYFVFKARTNANNQYISARNLANNLVSQLVCPTNGTLLSVFILAKKGQSLDYWYSSSSMTDKSLSFIYLECETEGE